CQGPVRAARERAAHLTLRPASSPPARRRRLTCDLRATLRSQRCRPRMTAPRWTTCIRRCLIARPTPTGRTHSRMLVLRLLMLVVLDQGTFPGLSAWAGRRFDAERPLPAGQRPTSGAAASAARARAIAPAAVAA